ncbi:MAG: hypothetical protein ACOZF0_08750 [Thermodesulfobacteriota bacterium]
MKKIWWMLLVLVFTAHTGSMAALADVIVISNPSVPVNSMSTTEIQDVFLGKTAKWGDDSKVSFVVLKGDVHKEFLKNYIKRTDSQYSAYWKQMLFSGKGSLPKTFDTEKELAQYVSETPGAIGYVSGTTAPANTKVISVN